MAAAKKSVVRRPAQRWPRRLKAYRGADVRRGARELAITAIPFAFGWCLSFWALSDGQFWLYAFLIPLTAGFLVRLFLIQHDCGHGSFFPNRRLNDWLGRLIGILTLTPYDHWRRDHALHHATSGNLDRRGVGDVSTLTVDEYLARSAWGQLRYRLYRHPLVMLGLGPTYLFVLQNRLPLGHLRDGWRWWLSPMATNLGVVAAAGATVLLTGLWPFLLVQVPIVLLGAASGVWLFYVQHQFDGTHWARGESWHVERAALRGSSFYDLPGVLRWFTANIGIHHVHHLASGIPYYRLPEVLRDHPELRDVGRVTIASSVRGLRLTLWDEACGRLISFGELRRRSLA